MLPKMSIVYVAQQSGLEMFTCSKWNMLTMFGLKDDEKGSTKKLFKNIFEIPPCALCKEEIFSTLFLNFCTKLQIQ